MTTPTITTNTDSWGRMSWIWSLIFFATIAFSLITALTDSDTSTQQMWLISTLSLTYVLWHVGFIYLVARPHRYNRTRFFRPALIYLIGVIAFWFVLTSLHPIFNFVLFALYAQIFGYVHLKWSIPLSVILTGLVTYLQAADSNVPLFSFGNTAIWYFIFASAGGIVLALYISNIITENVERRLLIEELQATRAELAAAERREGMLAERERLAREIHDTLAQGFIGVIMHLEASEPLIDKDRDKAQHHLTQAQDLARHGLSQARRVVQDLRPEVLESAPLPEAIGRVVTGWKRQSGIHAETAVTGDYQPLHPETEVTLIRATQEALANIQKHAHADDVRVTLSYLGNVIILDVQDNGIGLENAAAPVNGGGYGLTAMRQRVQQVGGQLTIESEPNDGTTIAIEIPIT